mmetsp:Transcript_10656/g.21917  ORF Transcript_10656/g.21917 Transcript_10656/m.21917 type:complete len:260 (+) Transcript_10656:138-917(+)
MAPPGAEKSTHSSLLVCPFEPPSRDWKAEKKPEPLFDTAAAALEEMPSICFPVPTESDVRENDPFSGGLGNDDDGAAAAKDWPSRPLCELNSPPPLGLLLNIFLRPPTRSLGLKAFFDEGVCCPLPRLLPGLEGVVLFLLELGVEVLSSSSSSSKNPPTPPEPSFPLKKSTLRRLNIPCIHLFFSPEAPGLFLIPNQLFELASSCSVPHPGLATTVSGRTSPRIFVDSDGSTPLFLSCSASLEEGPWSVMICCPTSLKK